MCGLNKSFNSDFYDKSMKLKSKEGEFSKNEAEPIIERVSEKQRKNKKNEYIFEEDFQVMNVNDDSKAFANRRKGILNRLTMNKTDIMR